MRRLKALCDEPVREAMGRSQQFPTMAAGFMRQKHEVETLRAALREAVAIIEANQ
jgi:hypothetical protein